MKAARLAAVVLLCSVLLAACTRMLENKKYSDAGKTRDRQFKAAALLNAHFKKNGSLPAQKYEAGRPRDPVPDGIDWEDMRDRNSPEWKNPIRYYPGAEGAWVLNAMGPDRDYDAKIGDWMFQSQAGTDGRWMNLQYDPTNGVVSGGDVMLASWQPPPDPRRIGGYRSPAAP